MRKQTLRTLAAILVFVAAAASVASAQPPLEVYFLNVDQGEATLIVSPSGKTLLIDGGHDGRGQGVVVPLLRGLNLTGLTYMVSSHYHNDHIGGLDEVVAAGFRPQIAYDRGTFGGVPNDSSYLGYANAVASVRRTITPGTIIDLGNGVTAECLVVNGQVKGGPNVKILGAPYFENAACVGLRIRYGNFQLWVGGDLQGGGSGTVDVESAVARSAGDFDVIQLNHHGSNSSTNWAFVYGLTPEAAVLSCGINNVFGHPHTEVLSRLNAFPGVRAIYQTTSGSGKPGGIWAQGTIRLRAAGNSYTVDGGILTPRTFPVDEVLPAPPHPRHAGELVVSEFLPDPAKVADADGEYVEIRNTTARPLDLIGLTLRDEGIDSIHIEKSVPVAAGGSVLVGRNQDPLRNGGFVPDLTVSGYYLANAGDEIRLDDPWGVPLDVVRYSSSTYPIATGAAAERIHPAGPSTASNFATAVTSFGLGDRGTPGNPNAVDPRFASHLAVLAGLPLPGRLLTFRLAGPAAKNYVLVISTTRAVTPIPGPVTLGVGLDLLPLTFVLPGWTGNLGSGVTTVGLAIPGVPALKGQVFYLQLVVFGSAIWPDSVSDVVRLRLG